MHLSKRPSCVIVTSKVVPTFVWSMGIGLGLCLLLGGCGGGSGGMGLALGGGTDRGPSDILAQAKNYLMGPDGRIQMPLDHVGSDEREGPKVALGGTVPKATGRGKVTVVESGLLYRVESDGLSEYLELQQHPHWCWAAAIQTAESYQLDSRGELVQRSIVQRIYPEPDSLPDQTALSMQIAEALASEAVRDRVRPLNLREDDMAASFGVLNDIFDVGASVDVSVDRLIEFLDQYMGSQELVASLAAGEPVLVSLGVDSEEGPYRHIYVVQAVDIQPISRLSSKEFLLRAVKTSAEEYMKSRRGQGMLGGLLSSGARGLSQLPGIIDIASRQHYAIKTVYLLDPWKDEGDSNTPEDDNFIEMPGEMFASNAFFLINRSTADRILTELEVKRADVVKRIQ